MAAYNIEQNRYGIKDTTEEVTIPGSYRARLMYYFNSKCIK